MQQFLQFLLTVRNRVFGQMAVTQELLITAPGDGEEHKPHTYEILRISEVER